MSLKHALLVALDENKGTGYEIAKWFQEGPGNFWHTSHQQIYRELANMTERQWVTFEEVPQVGKPGKKVYEVTAAGKQELIDWLLQPTPSCPLKDALLMKVYAGHLIPAKQLSAEIQRVREQQQETLQRYHDIEREVFTAQNLQNDAFQYAHLTLQNGIIMTHAWLTWADKVITFLNSKQK